MRHLAILAILLASALTCSPPAWHTKKRLAAEARQGFTTITQKHLASRELARNTGTYRPLRIHFDLTPIEATLASLNLHARIPFYRKVFAATGKWWGKAVQVNDDKSLILPEIQSYIQDYPEVTMNMPASPEDYDLFVIVKWSDEVGNSSTFAWAGPTLRHPASQRPIFGDVGIEKWGDALWAGQPKTGMRGAMATAIHEFGHIISFIGWEQFQSANIAKIDNGKGGQMWVWTGPIVTAKAKAYYNCAGNWTGAPLQSSAEGGTGGHWQEEFFGPEAMSPMAGAEPELFSDMTLALCEDSGWYKANYGMSEDYTYGKGRGCNASNCSTQGCDPAQPGQFASANRRSLSSCEANSYGCGVVTPDSRYNCNKAANYDAKATSYGASFTDNCTVANGDFVLVEDGYILSLQQLPVEASCDANETYYDLTLKNATLDENDARTGTDVVVRCNQSGTVEYNQGSWNGKGSVQCEDPATFCKARFGGNENCTRGCDMQGRCAHTSLGPQEYFTKRFVSRKMLGGTKKISMLAESGISTDWQCWCYSDGEFSTQQDGSCPVAA